MAEPEREHKNTKRFERQQAKAQRARDQHAIKEAQRKAKQAQEMAAAAKRKEAAARLQVRVFQRAASRYQRQPGRASFCLENAHGKMEAIDFESFSAIAKAAVSHVSKSQYGFELLLSNGSKLSVEPGTEGLSVQVKPVVSDEIASARVWIIGKDEKGPPTAALIEKRLWHLRQLYAVLYLLFAEQGETVAESQYNDANADLEQFVPADYRLQVYGLGLGSHWVDVVVSVLKKGYEKAKAAPQKALNALSLFTSEGRELLMRRVRANTETGEAEARKKGAEARTAEGKATQAAYAAEREGERLRQDRIKTTKAELDVLAAIDAKAAKFKNPKLKEAALQRLIVESESLGGDNGKKPSLPPAN